MWFKVDDQLPTNRKVRRLVRSCPSALGLWLVAGTTCSAEHAEGVVTADMLADAAQDAGLSQAMGRKAVAALVEVGMWHDHTTIKRCDGCLAAVDGKLAKGSIYFHDWGRHQFVHDPAKRLRPWRRKIPKAVRHAVMERDGWTCQRCGATEDLTLDHILPYSMRGADTEANLRVLCRTCNSSRGARDR